MRNFQIQTNFLCNYSNSNYFFQENVAANNFLANFLAGFVTLLLPLTIPDFIRTVFAYLYPLCFPAVF